jgi:hypothetical protein
MQWNVKRREEHEGRKGKSTKWRKHGNVGLAPSLRLTISFLVVSSEGLGC